MTAALPAGHAARCVHCDATWLSTICDPPDMMEAVRIGTELSAHLRDVHGDEQRALWIERSIVRTGTAR